MEETFAIIADHVALGLEALVVLIITAGAIMTIYGIVRQIALQGNLTGARRETWMRFARWLVLALEFALAADIVRTAIAPTWDDIGQLAAIAAIRTFLGYFLEKDIDAFEPPEDREGSRAEP